MDFQGTTYVNIGKILKPQGIRGEFVVYLESDFPEWLRKRKSIHAWRNGSLETWRVVSARFQGQKLIYKVDALPDRNAVEAARDTKLFVPEEEARQANSDPDYFFNADLIGLTVVDDENDTVYGEVVDIIEMPVQNLVEVRDPQNRTFLIPFAAALIPGVDLEEGTMYVALPEGLLPGEGEDDESPDKTEESGE